MSGAGRLVADSGYPYESSRVYYIREVLCARTVFEVRERFFILARHLLSHREAVGAGKSP